MFDGWATKLPNKPFHSDLLPVIRGMNIVSGGSVYNDFSQMGQSLRALYADYLKRNPAVKGITAAPATALVGLGGDGKGKGKGKGWFGGGKGIGSSHRRKLLLLPLLAEGRSSLRPVQRSARCMRRVRIG